MSLWFWRKVTYLVFAVISNDDAHKEGYANHAAEEDEDMNV